MLAWVLAESPLRIRTTPASEWTGCDELSARWEWDGERAMIGRFETRYDSRRGITGKLRIFIANEGNITFEAAIPNAVVEKSKARILGAEADNADPG